MTMNDEVYRRGAPGDGNLLMRATLSQTLRCGVAF